MESSQSSVALEIIDILLTDAILGQDLEPRVNGEFFRHVLDSVDAILNATDKDILDNMINEQLERQIERIEFNLKRISLGSEIEKLKSKQLNRRELMNAVGWLQEVKTGETVLNLLLYMLKNTPDRFKKSIAEQVKNSKRWV